MEAFVERQLNNIVYVHTQRVMKGVRRNFIFNGSRSIWHSGVTVSLWMWALYVSDDVINKCLSVMICYSEGVMVTLAPREKLIWRYLYDLMSTASGGMTIMEFFI